MNAQALDEGRAKVLHDVESAERLYRAAFWGAVAVEGALLSALVLVADLQNATHRLLAIGFVGSYSIVVLAIVALGAHVSRLAQRILRAVALAQPK